MEEGKHFLDHPIESDDDKTKTLHDDTLDTEAAGGSGCLLSQIIKDLGKQKTNPNIGLVF